MCGLQPFLQHLRITDGCDRPHSTLKEMNQGTKACGEYSKAGAGEFLQLGMLSTWVSEPGFHSI